MERDVQAFVGGLILSTGVMKLVVPRLRAAWGAQLDQAGLPLREITYQAFPVVEVGVGGDSGGGGIGIGPTMRYISTGTHFETLMSGGLDTVDLVYFAVVIGIFLLLAKTAVEAARWR